jgi:hypothetical protein
MATRSIRYVSRDKTVDLLNKIVTSWPHARPADAEMGAQMGDSGLEGTATVSPDSVGAGSPAAAHSQPAGSDSPEGRDGEAQASSSSVTADSSSLRKRSLEAGHGAAPSGNGVRRSGGEGGVGGEGGSSSRIGGVGVDDSSSGSRLSDDEFDCSWSDEPSEPGEDGVSRPAAPGVRANLCAILEGAVKPMASGRSTQLAVSPTLQEQKNHGLLLTQLDFEEEEEGMGAEAALESGIFENDVWYRIKNSDSIRKTTKPSDSDISSQFPDWFHDHECKDGLKYMKKPQNVRNQREPEPVKDHRTRLENYRRRRRLEPILKCLHQISQGKSEVALTCGIGILRKEVKDDGRQKQKQINCPILEIDLTCCRNRLNYELSPDALDYASKIRLCPSLSRLEESRLREDREALEDKISKRFDQWMRRNRKKKKVQINPFDPSTYRSLLNRIGRDLDSNFTEVKTRDAYDKDDKGRWVDFRQFLLSDNSITKNLEIYDTWIIFQRKKQDASKIVSQDAQRFLKLLRDPRADQDIPKFWTRICTEDDLSSAPAASSRDLTDFLLPLKQNMGQLEILEKLESNDCVVVQGPPGTGKSHTIGKTEFVVLPLDLDVGVVVCD